MLVLKYQKQGSACFISHIDLLRHVDRIIRRAHIEVKFSQGFNPHPLLFFSPPLSLGTASVAEYLSIDSDMDKDVAFERYNASVPDGLKASKIFVCSKNPNLQAKVTCADFVFPTAYRNIDLSNGFIVQYKKKGEIVKEDVEDKLFAVFEKDGKLAMRLASGACNLRPDRILDKLGEIVGEKIDPRGVVKTAQYVDVDGKIVDVDEFLQTV